MNHVLLRLAGCGLLVLALAGCGGGEEASLPVDADTRADARGVAGALAEAGMGLVSTEGLPEFVEMYRGGTPVMHMRTGDGGKSGGVLSYTVEAPLADVVAFHRESMKKAGIQITTEMSAQDSISFGGTGKGETLSLLTTIAPGEDGVTVSQTYSHAGG